jgi:hypothetical protein
MALTHNNILCLILGFSGHGAYGPPMATPGMGLQGVYDDGYPSIGSRYGTGSWAPHDPHGYPQL